jgi:hypothetical protein
LFGEKLIASMDNDVRRNDREYRGLSELDVHYLIMSIQSDLKRIELLWYECGPKNCLDASPKPVASVRLGA